jgi:hypothetical protein
MLTDQRIQELKTKYNLNSKPTGSQIMNQKNELRGQALIDSLNQKEEQDINDTGSFGSRVKQDVAERGKQTMQALENDKQSDFSKGFQTGGATLGLANDVAGEAMQSIPGHDLGPKVVDSVLNTKHSELIPGDTGQIVRLYQTAKPLIEKIKTGLGDTYSNIKDKNPELAANLDSLVEAFKFASLAAGAKSAIEAVPTNPINASKEALGITAEAQQAKSLKTAINAVKQETKYMTPTEREAAMKTEGGMFKKAEPPITAEDQRLATKFKEQLSSENHIQNENNLKKYLANKSQDMENYLSKEKRPFDPNELRPKLKAALDEVFPEGVKEATKNDVIETMISKIKPPKPGEPATLVDVWKGRSKFDKAVDSIFGQEGTSAAADIKKAARDATNQFVEDQIPDSVYKAKLKDMSDAYKTLDRVSPKAAKALGKTGVQKIMSEYPTTTKILKKGAFIGAGALGAKELLR